MERVFKIINLLLSSKGPITINDIAGSLNVSNKTIRNDMVQAEEYLNKRGMKLSKKPGVGIEVEGPEEEKANIAFEIEKGFKEQYIYTPEGRKNYILKRLFTSDGSITIKELADELYVSRVTIHKDLHEVDEWLNKYELKLYKKTNYGIEIIGKEENWRNAVASLIVLNKENDELKELLYDDYGGRIDYKTILKLKELVNLDYKLLEKIVANAESKLNIKFSDEAFISLVIHIAISIKRLKSHKDVTLSEEVLKKLKQMEEYPVAKKMAGDIEEAFNVKLPQSEIGYILLHIIGSKMQQNKLDEIDAVIEEQGGSDMPMLISKEIINIAQKALNLNFEDDKQLLNGLILHLRPTINRLKYGLTLRNPILDEIKENYPEIYGVAWMTSIVFEKYLGTKISEEEVGYIALHLGAAVERKKKPLKALVVCTSGIGTSQLLAAKLEKHFRQIEIKDIVSVISLKGNTLDDVDIVISTVPIEANKPVINISPLLNENDLKRLDRFLSNVIDGLYNKNANSSDTLLDFINEDFIETGVAFNNKQELIREISNKLLQKGYVTDEYCFSMLKREQSMTTAVGNGVAIPHGSPVFVNKSIIPIMILKDPIEWGDEYVDIIFVLCISQADVKKSRTIMRNLYKLTENPDFIKSLKNKNSSLELKKGLEVIINADK